MLYRLNISVLSLTVGLQSLGCSNFNTALPDKTPHEAWYKQKPEMGHIRVWGCTAYVFVQKDKRKKLESHMEKCIFVGYPAGYKGWRLSGEP